MDVGEEVEPTKGKSINKYPTAKQKQMWGYHPSLLPPIQYSLLFQKLRIPEWTRSIVMEVSLEVIY